MKKCILISLMMAIIPTYVFGASARYNQLVAEKQQKMAELEKCSGNINGWKIAGISTLGLTAVGVAGNIALSNTQKDYDKKIEKTDKQISDTQENIKKLEEQKRLAAAEQILREQCERAGGTYNNSTCTCNETGKVYQNGACVVITVTTVTQPQRPTTVQPTDTTDCTAEARAKDEKVIKATKNGDKCEVVACVDTHIVKADKTGCELKSENTSKTPTVANGADCTAEMLKKDKNVAEAKIKNGKCEVVACVDTHTVKADKTGCELKSENISKTPTVADGTDCTADAQKTDKNVTKAHMQDGKCVVVACVDTHTVKADKTGCELKSENTSKTPTVANGADCTAEMLKKDKNVAEAKIKNGKCEVISCISTHDVNNDKTGCVKKTSKNTKVNDTQKTKKTSKGDSGYDFFTKCRENGGSYSQDIKNINYEPFAGEWCEVTDPAICSSLGAGVEVKTYNGKHMCFLQGKKYCKISQGSGNRTQNYMHGTVKKNQPCTLGDFNATGDTCDCICNDGKWNCYTK